MSLSFLNDIIAPGAAFRGKPFWAWNGKLDPEELKRQIGIMHRMGLGGFFMHSRVGLATPYLSTEWYECVNACIEEAAKLGMEAWLYDEDRWPSGAAGGLVTQQPEYRKRNLLMQVLADPAELVWDGQTLAAFTAYIAGAEAHKVVQIHAHAQPATLEAGHVILRFVVEEQQGSSWFNGYTYLDTLSHEAVQQFLRVTHEAYHTACGPAFGSVVPGIFTDEPEHGRMPANDNGTGAPLGMPWTAKLPGVFQQRYGYDLLPYLVELFFDVDGQAISQARYHFHDCVTHLFVDAFARKIGAWCEEHAVLFTGHVVEEDTLAHQTAMVGSAMRFYEHMQAPGMDVLTEHSRIFNTAKQVSSMARQFGRQWRLTETYGCTGWDFPFVGHKAVGDWQVALGITLRCQHLAWYTMLGEAKRDYPASISYQSPWWEWYPKVEDYFARVLAIMTRGTEVRDLLVIHPVESAWVQCKTGWLHHPHTQAYDHMLDTVCETLLAGHVDFDYGDEEVLSRHATVRTEHGAPELVVNKAAYTAVLVPPLLTMRASTLRLLQDFKRAGGAVIFAGDPAQYVDALPSSAVVEFARSCITGVPTQGHDLVKAVEGRCRRVSIIDEAGNELAPVLYLLREDDEAMYLFLCNTGEDVTNGRHPRKSLPVRDRTLALPHVVVQGFAECAGAPLLVDPESGAISRANATRTTDGWEIRTSLPAVASRIYVIPKQATAIAGFPSETSLQTVCTIPISGDPWTIQLTDLNPLVLDRPRYRIGTDEWQPETEILRLDRIVRDVLEAPHRGGSMVQPWARAAVHNECAVPVTLSYRFDAQALPSGELFLAIEQPQSVQISLNGTTLSVDTECGWWADRSLRTIPIDPALIHLGENDLVVTYPHYTESHSGLEIIYLLGHFGTAVQGTRVALTEAPVALRPGDWVGQGLAFYAGSVVYLQPITVSLAAGERLFVQIPHYRGIGMRVLVNGVQAGIIGWQPNEVEITDFVGQGSALLQLEVIGHRRNSHGPHHLADPSPAWTGPGEFQARDDRWFEGYQCVPCGLMSVPNLVMKRESS